MKLKSPKFHNLTFKKLSLPLAALSLTLALVAGGVFAWQKRAQVADVSQEVKSAEIQKDEKPSVASKGQDTKAEQKPVTVVPKPPTPVPVTPKVVAKPAPKPAVKAPVKTPISKRPATPVPKTPVAAAPAVTNGIYSVAAAQNYVEEEVLRLVNAERARLGVRSLYFDSRLRQAADIRAREETILSFSGINHLRPDGRSFGTVLQQVGYTGATAWGENLAWGYKSQFSFNQTNLKALAAKIFSQWKNSPGHYAQLKDPKYNYTGVGVVLVNQNGRTYYFADQLFARR